MDDFHDARGCCGAFLEAVVGFDYGEDGRDGAGKDDDEEDEDGGVDVAADYPGAADDEDDDECECAKHFGEGGGEFGTASHADGGAGEGGVGGGEVSGEAFFAAEGFDNADGVERLVDEGEHSPEDGAAFAGVGLEVFPDDGDEFDADGEDEKEEEEEAPRDEEECGAEDEDVEWRLDYHLEHADDVPLDVGEVVGHAADEVAAAVVVEEGDGEDGDAVVEVVAEAFDEAVAEDVEVDGGEVAEEVAQEGAGEVCCGDDEQALPEAEGGTVEVEVVESPAGEGFLREGELGFDGWNIDGAEEELDEGHYHHVGAQVEEDVEEGEEDVEDDLGGEEAEVFEDADDGFHRLRI